MAGEATERPRSSRKTAAGVTAPEPPSEPAGDPTEAQDEATPPEPQTAALRYTGQFPSAFLDLGGEVKPDDIVRPPNPDVASCLIARGDFIAVDSDDSGTAD